MQYLLLGFAALLLFLLAARGYTIANPQVLARQLRIGAGVAALAGAGFLLCCAAWSAMPCRSAALGSWLLWGGGLPWGCCPAARRSRRARPRASSPSTWRSSSTTTPATSAAAC
mgnify:CR=1 FL=1